MQIIGTAKNESKEPLFDAKTGNKKREISELLIKCKWFNPSSEKMSEKLIPIEALSIIPKVDEEKLSKIDSFVKNREHIVIKFNGRETIINPQDIRCTHGFYTLSGYDYLSNKVEEFPINDKLTILEKCENRFSIKVPNFQNDELKKEKYPNQLEKVICEAKSNNSYIRIKYGDRNGNLTFRTIRNFIIHNTAEETYLIGYCMIRKAERNFHFDRIQFLEVLNLKQPSKS